MVCSFFGPYFFQAINLLALLPPPLPPNEKNLSVTHEDYRLNFIARPHCTDSRISSEKVLDLISRMKNDRRQRVRLSTKAEPAILKLIRNQPPRTIGWRGEVESGGPGGSNSFPTRVNAPAPTSELLKAFSCLLRPSKIRDSPRIVQELETRGGKGKRGPASIFRSLTRVRRI